MSPIVSFFVFMAGFGGTIVLIVTAPFWADRLVVWVLRSHSIIAFPEAIRMAVSLERDTAEWRFTKHEAEHQQIGAAWIANGAGGIHVDVKLGNDTLEWKPNWIERRVIYDAAMLARARVIREQLDKVLPR
jgi:hypothetical protein